MAAPKSLGPSIENKGEALRAFVDGLKDCPSIARKYLVEFGLIKEGAEIDPSAWYAVDGCLAVYHAISEEVGPNTSYAIGKRIPENAVFPPNIKDIQSAMQSIDVAYHMNHRKNGKLMFDPATGQMQEGIGHYLCEIVRNEHKLVMVCENPYPCDFDRGIVSAMAARFQSNALVVHEPRTGCRKTGAKACRYVVTW